MYLPTQTSLTSRAQKILTQCSQIVVNLKLLPNYKEKVHRHKFQITFTSMHKLHFKTINIASFVGTISSFLILSHSRYVSGILISSYYIQPLMTKHFTQVCLFRSVQVRFCVILPFWKLRGRYVFKKYLYTRQVIYCERLEEHLGLIDFFTQEMPSQCEHLR